MAAHWDASQQRISQHKLVLCLQDTTELDYNGQQMQGLGPLSYEAQRGLYLHPTYVVTPQREPLGVTNAWMWARQFKDGEAPRGGLLESRRWIESDEIIAEQALKLPDTRHVFVGDRESNILALMLRAKALKHAVDYMVRCQHNRALPQGDKLWERVMKSESLGVVVFSMLAGRGRKAQGAHRQARDSTGACEHRGRQQQTLGRSPIRHVAGQSRPRKQSKHKPHPSQAYKRAA